MKFYIRNGARGFYTIRSQIWKMGMAPPTLSEHSYLGTYSPDFNNCNSKSKENYKQLNLISEINKHTLRTWKTKAKQFLDNNNKYKLTITKIIIPISFKRLVVVFKGIESSVNSNEIRKALVERGDNTKTVCKYF